MRRSQSSYSAGSGSAQTRTVQLRLLATTDLHMQLTGFDYVADRPTETHGLAGLATLIDDARAEAADAGRACLLFDNGDLLQGNAMGAYLARQETTVAHPVARCMNHLGYDAVGLGNHDFDFGLDYLKDQIAQLAMPVVASNLAGVDIGPLHRSALVECPMPEGGATLRVGVLSVLPRETARWNRHVVGPAAEVLPPEDYLRSAVPALQAQGAELIIVLAHLGISSVGDDQTDCALALGRVPGVDAVVAGHTHRRFPEQDQSANAEYAPPKGQVQQVPTVMPGHSGSDLAVVDLTLNKRPGQRWQVIGHLSRLRQNTRDVRPHPDIVAAVAPAHEALRRHLATPLGELSGKLHNYFALAAPTGTAALTARAEFLNMRAVLDVDETRPVLVASYAHSAGGREGPDRFLTMAPGQVLRRHLAGLIPYSNELWALQITGAQLRQRLEHAASVFTRLDPARNDRPLLRPEKPAFDFETVFGVTYQIDPSAAAGARILHLKHNGHPVEDTQPFLLVTNQYRAVGGGGFEPVCPGQRAARVTELDEAFFTQALSEEDSGFGWDDTPPWTFSPNLGVAAEIETSPLAEPHLDEIAHLRPVNLGLTPDGFLRLRLSF